MDRAIYRIGFLSGLLAFGAAVSYCVVQLFQMYGVLTYPADEILIYGTSLLIVIPFVLEILALHYTAPADKKFWTHAAIVFTTLYAVFVTSNYVVQLATVIPMTLKGKLDEIPIFQQTPHSLFWDFDGLGYIFMGLASAAIVPIFKKEGFEKWARVAFIANALMTPLITIVYFYPVFSIRLLLLGFPWAVTAPMSMLMLSIVFKKKMIRNKVKSNKSELPPQLVDVGESEGY